MLPYVIYFCLFTAFPVVFAIYLSFHRWTNLYAPPIPNGIHNYQYLVGDGNFWNALRVTVIFVVVFVAVMIPLTLALALALNQGIFGRSFFRAAFFMPYITPSVVVALIAVWMFQTQNGILNNLLGLIGVTPIPWLTNRALAMPSIALLAVWKNAGYYIVIFLAGLQSIPRQLYEAAAVDGANAWTQFWRISLPLLAPAMLLVVVFATLTGFGLFTEPYILTQGGPGNATMTVTFYIYKWAFEFGRMGYASTLGAVFAVLIFVVVLVEKRILEREPYF